MGRLFRHVEPIVIVSIIFSAIGCQQSGSVPPPVSLSSIPHSNNASETLSNVSSKESEFNRWVPNVEQRDWKYIVVHHTASLQGDVESIHRTHLKRKDSKGNPWRGIGYHFVIGNGNGMKDGEVESTFRWKEQIGGAHAGVAEYNSHGIGICFIGNFEEISPTRAQVESAKKLIAFLKENYSIDTNHVIGHGEIKATACPGKFLVMEEINENEDS